MSEIIDLQNIKNTENIIKIKFDSNEKDFSLINFYDLENNKKELLASEATKNILVTGATGSGKTTSILLPILENLIKNNCPGLILDIKSDLYSHIYTIANKENKLNNILFIGTYDFCQNINILASIKNVNQLKNILNSIKATTHSESYWWENGVDDVIDIVILHEWLIKNCQNQEYIYSFKNIFDYINKDGYVKEIVEQAEAFSLSANEEIISIINKIKSEPFSLYNITNNSDADDKRQKMWRSGQVSNVIAPFIKQPFSSQFSDIQKNTTIHDYIYKQGKIIVLVMPIEHESVGHTIGKLIREIFFKSVLSNNNSEREIYSIGKENNRYTFLLIDEYQFFVNSEGKNGVVTDESWVSISRSYGNINIFATQSITSLISKTKSEIDIDTIHQNCVNEIYLPTKDKRTINYISYFNSELNTDNQIDMNIIKNPQPNTRLGLCRLSNNGGVDNFIFDSKHAIEYLRFHSSDYISEKNKNEIKLLSQIKPVEIIEFKNSKVIYANNNYLKLSNSKKIILENFYMIESIKSLLDHFNNNIKDQRMYILYKDFLKTPNNITISDSSIEILKKDIHKLKKYKEILLKNKCHYSFNEFIKNNDINRYTSFLKNNSIDLNIKILTYPASKAKIDIKYTSSHLTEGDFMSINEILKILYRIDKFPEVILTKKDENILNKIKEASFICISRGGGDFLSNDFDHFRNLELIRFIYKFNKNAIILSALSHAQDSFIVDLYSDYSFITPTAFASWADNIIKCYNGLRL